MDSLLGATAGEYQHSLTTFNWYITTDMNNVKTQFVAICSIICVHLIRPTTDF